MKHYQAILKKITVVRILVLSGLVFMLLLTGCATSIPIKSVRPPTIDTSNIQRLGIRPFENISGVEGRLGAQLTQYLSDKTTELVTRTGKFTIVAPSDPNADGVFTGDIKDIIVNDSYDEREIKDAEGNITIETTYKRDVSVIFSYSILSSRTDMPIGTVTKQGSSSDSDIDPSYVSDALTIARGIVDSQLSSLQNDLIPSIVSTNRTLMKEKSKDKFVKQRMNEIQELVKNGYYDEAISQYDEIANQYGSVAARTNSNILREAVASDIAANAELNQFYTGTSAIRDQAVEAAINALETRLPSGTNIMFVKTSYERDNLIDDVVDEMTKIIVADNSFNVIDRTHQALINAEQTFQYSGYVSDDSMVEVGRQLGVQYMVLCSISGEKSLRRLNIKVLNVETAQITIQDDFEI
jgi:TolB-like protein